MNMIAFQVKHKEKKIILEVRSVLKFKDKYGMKNSQTLTL